MTWQMRFREWLAYKIAPWTYVPYREEREEAFRELALMAYASRDAVWTSPTVLARMALERAYHLGDIGKTVSPGCKRIP